MKQAVDEDDEVLITPSLVPHSFLSDQRYGKPLPVDIEQRAKVSGFTQIYQKGF